MTGNPARITPRPVEDWDEEVRDALSVLSARRSVQSASGPSSAGAEGAPAQPSAGGGGAPAPRPSDMIGIFAWHPSLTKHWLTFSHHLAESTLSDRVREMVIVRVAWLRRGEFEWAQHRKFARAAGMSDEELEALNEGPDAKVWGPSDATIVRAVDELCNDHYISDSTWGQLETQFDRKQLMDLVFTTTGYDLHATAFNTFGLQMPDGLERFPTDIST